MYKIDYDINLFMKECNDIDAPFFVAGVFDLTAFAELLLRTVNISALVMDYKTAVHLIECFNNHYSQIFYLKTGNQEITEEFILEKTQSLSIKKGKFNFYGTSIDVYFENNTENKVFILSGEKGNSLKGVYAIY